MSIKTLANRKGIPITPSVKSQIIELFSMHTIGYIARELNIHRDTVKKYLKEANVY